MKKNKKCKFCSRVPIFYEKCRKVFTNRPNRREIAKTKTRNNCKWTPTVVQERDTSKIPWQFVFLAKTILVALD